MGYNSRLEKCVIETKRFLIGELDKDVSEYIEIGKEATLGFTLEFFNKKEKVHDLVNEYLNVKRKSELENLMFEFYLDWTEDLIFPICERFRIPPYMVKSLLKGKKEYPGLFPCREERAYYKALKKTRKVIK